MVELELANLGEHKSSEIEGLLKNLLPEYLPMRIEHTYYDYQIIRTDGHSSTLLIVAMKRNVLNGYINMLSSAGIIPVTITISPIAFR